MPCRSLLRQAAAREGEGGQARAQQQQGGRHGHRRRVHDDDVGARGLGKIQGIAAGGQGEIRRQGKHRKAVREGARGGGVVGAGRHVQAERVQAADRMVAIDVAAIIRVAIGGELEDHAIGIRMRQAAGGAGSIAGNIEDIHDRHVRLVAHRRHAGAQVAPSHEAEGDEAGARQGQVDRAGERVAGRGRGGAHRVAPRFRYGLHGGARASEQVAEGMGIAAGKFQHGTGRGSVVVLRQACAAAAGAHLQHVGIGCRARIDGARIDGHAPLEEGAVAGIAVGARQRQGAGTGGDAEIVQFIDGQAVRARLRLAAGQPAGGGQDAQPAQGLASCVIDVHRSLIIVVIVGGEIRGSDPGLLA